MSKQQELQINVPGMIYCPIKKGEKIIEQGEPAERIYYLTKGKCYRMVLNDKGDEIIYGIKQTDTLAQSLVGVINIYGGEISGSSFVAQTDCEGYYIHRDAFFKYAEDKPALLSALLRMAAQEHYELYINYQSRQEGRVANRLCQLLLDQAKPVGGRLVLDRSVTNVLLGQFLGIHHVTVAKIMKQLKSQGIIRRTSQGTIIDSPEALREYAQGKKMVYQKQ